MNLASVIFGGINPVPKFPILLEPSEISIHLLLNATCISLFRKVAESSGKLTIKFVKFNNPGSRIQTGSCCDNVHFCISSCEIFIRFCLTVQSQSSSCSLINFETPVLGDDSFMFSNSLGNGVPNPVVHSFDKWTVSI